VTTYRELVAAATVGIAQRPLSVVELPEPASEYGTVVDADPAVGLLDAVALLDATQRAGRLATVISLPPPAPADACPEQAGQGLKSIFRLLRAGRVLFLDPTARVKTGEHRPTGPLPADVEALRAALDWPHAARSTVVALIAFHGLRVGQLRRLHLTDIRDSRLHLDGRVVVLATPVLDRITRWLDYRNTRWPNTANPHLFVHYRTAGTLDPVGRRWVGLAVGDDLSPAAIRDDRILDEVVATRGDPRRLSELFGLSIQAGTRYTATIEHPDLRDA
jgi:integrase